MSLMPLTFSVALMGAFSMAGLPPFSGFLSKEMFFTSVLNIREFDILNTGFWVQLFPVIAWIASVFTFVYSMILVFKTFGGKIQKDKLDKVPHEAPLGLLLSPVILISLTLVFAFFPDLVSATLIEPAMASIHTGLLAPGEAFEVSIHFWHGWTPEIFMTLGVIAAGLLLYKGYTRLRVLEREASGRNTLNRIYDASLQLLERGSKRLTDAYMTGSNRHYLLYIFSFFIIALLAVLLGEPGISFGMKQYAELSFYELAVIVVMLLAAFAVPFAKSRVNAILFTGGVGYMVTLLFVLFRAPDLALTQMIIETVSVILFLLCFRYLPKLKKQKEVMRFKLPNLIIALGVGVTVTLIALAAMGTSPFEPISEFFLKESYNLAGGKNVVNVILVDFRGFDTLFEIMVLGIASLGIYGLINLRVEDTPLQTQQEKSRLAVPLRSNDVILQTMSKGIVLIILVFSLYLFFAGHNHPGGGFIGALMTSAALVLIAIAFGMEQTRKSFPVNYRLLTAAGLLLAILTASGSFLFGAPFLSHAFGHFHLPLLGDVELATAVLFDLGVYLAVVGVAMNIILTIGGDKRWNS